MSVNAVEIRGLTKRFPGFALGPIDLTVPRGSIYGFVGPNGAGKTTTIDLMFGIGAKDSGRIEVVGRDHIRDDIAVKERVGYVSPDLNFQPWSSVKGTIAFFRAFRPSWDDTYCERLLASFRLGWNEKVMSLSFGARIKLALILALAWRPELLVLDEPTVGLDAISKAEVFGELLAAVRDGDRSVLISSHALADLERFADHVGMIKAGQMLFEGSLPDIVDRFRMVDLSSDGPAPASRPGLWLQARANGRTRALVDRQRLPIETLSGHGATILSESPVTLEDVFVSLGRD